MNAYERIARAKLSADIEHQLMEEEAALRGFEEDCIRAVKSARRSQARVRRLLGIIGQSLEDLSAA